MEVYVFGNRIHVQQEEVQRVFDLDLGEKSQETIQEANLLTCEERGGFYLVSFEIVKGFRLKED